MCMYLHCAQVIRVGNEEVFLINWSSTPEYKRALYRFPCFSSSSARFGQGNSVAFKIRGYLDWLKVGVFLDNTQGIFMSIDHEDERYINLVGRVEVFDLTHSEIEESYVVFDLQGTFGAGHT